MANKWTLQDLPRLNGRVALVTGANRGLGLEISAALAGAGAHVVMACRDPGRATAALERVLERAPQAQVETMGLDLADLATVRGFAQDFSARFRRLDLLVNNGSAILVPLGQTRDGFETHIGTNHLGHFALTGLLLPLLRATPGARVVSTSSMAHKMTKGLNLDDLHFEHRPYKEMDAYGQSKLATLIYSRELDRRLRAAGLDVVSVAAHPGWTNTNPEQGNAVMRFFNGLIAQSVAMGALPALYAAAAPEAKGGEYYGPGGLQELRGYPAKAASSEQAQDAARLWERSEALTGVRYAFD